MCNYFSVCVCVVRMCMCVYECVSVSVCVCVCACVRVWVYGVILKFYLGIGYIYQPAISDMDNTEVFLIHSATINMSRVSDDGSESIDIDYTTQQQLRAMNVTTDGKIIIIHSDIV